MIIFRVRSILYVGENYQLYSHHYQMFVMKKILFILACLLHSIMGSAQNTTCDWAYAHKGTNTFNGDIYNTAIDHQGNIIQCGTIYGVADMDPGNGPADTAYTYPGYNYYISKTDITGHLIWLKFFNSTSPVQSFSIDGIEINSQNEIIVLGEFFGLLDVDISAAGVDTLRSFQPTYPDFFLAKYDSTGGLIWANSYGGTGGTLVACSMSLMSNDNIVVSFLPSINMDLNPGPGSATVTTLNGHLACYDTDGNYIWDNNITNPYSYGVEAKTTGCDADNNIYLCTAGSNEMTVAKFNAAGNLLWEKKVGDFATGSQAEAHSLLVYPDGRFFIVGNFYGTVDFDPGPGVLTYVSTSVIDMDGFFAAYDSSMTPIWVKAYTGGRIYFGRQSLAAMGTDLVTGGQIAGSVNIAPGVNFNSGTYGDFVLKTDAFGNMIGGDVFISSGKTQTVNCDATGRLILAGNFSGMSDMDLTPNNVYTLTSGNSSTSFVAVYASPLAGLHHFDDSHSVSTYPNPARDIIHLTKPLNEIAEIRITDINGKSIISQTLQPGETRLNTASLTTGVYLLHIKTEKSATITRFITSK